ncbi:hypothetical protein Maq22A_c08440 [Methylobacterium aquaticum]|uniref:Uncharacterized protein n=1 Tax=Methylobacterium aquaticum TaxID=270351 RepID=A0A0C6EXT9_9HYPH|nr:hypothetical protein Maq22A_c08440 [Methylobacterium aquaticum]
MDAALGGAAEEAREGDAGRGVAAVAGGAAGEERNHGRGIPCGADRSGAREAVAATVPACRHNTTKPAREYDKGC